MAMARFSCGTRIGRGTLAPLSLARAKPSTMGGKSVPGLAKKNSTPCRGNAARMTSAAVNRALPAVSPRLIRGLLARSVELYVGGLGNLGPARNLSGNLGGEGRARAAARVDEKPDQALAHLGQADDLGHF